MIVHTPKTMTILSSGLVLIGFFGTSCVGINLGDIPRGLRHPRDVPSVDPSTLGQKPYTPSPPSSIVTVLKFGVSKHRILKHQTRTFISHPQTPSVTKANTTKSIEFGVFKHQPITIPWRWVFLWQLK